MAEADVNKVAVGGCAVVAAATQANKDFWLDVVEDQWSELLPTKIPLRYSFFR